MSEGSYYSSGAPSPAKPPTLGTSYPLKSQYGYNQVPVQYTDEQLEAMRRHDAKLKRQIRILRIVSRVLTAILSTVVTIIMATTLHKYLSTKDMYINGRTAWARNTKLWPTVMLFTIAAVTLVLNLIIMIAYACSVKSANRASLVSGVFGILVFVGHIFVWISAAAIYRYSKDTNGKSNDLWGWACSKTADDIQQTFEFIVNFDHICNSNSDAWFTSIAEACLEVLTLIIYIFAFRRLKHKKKMELAQSAIPVQSF